MDWFSLKPRVTHRLIHRSWGNPWVHKNLAILNGKKSEKLGSLLGIRGCALN